MRSAVFAKFDETVELAMRLGVDPKHADQMVRGTVVLPQGKSKRVAAIAAGDKTKEATEAGADHVGGDDLVEKIQGGWRIRRGGGDARHDEGRREAWKIWARAG